MKIIEPGYLYELENKEKPDRGGQRIQFIEKVPVAELSNQMATICDGTTNEDVIEVLLDRLRGVGAKIPCEENQRAIAALEVALSWMKERTLDRQRRGVEGTCAP